MLIGFVDGVQRYAVEKSPWVGFHTVCVCVIIDIRTVFGDEVEHTHTHTSDLPLQKPPA